MSTYTDLHNRIRENLTILRQPGSPLDGMTPQRVIFTNPANIYEGTFKGKVDATDVSLLSATLTNVIINGGTIADAKIVSDGQTIDVVELTSNVAEISGKVDGSLSKIDSLRSTVDTKVWQLSNDIVSGVVEISVDNILSIMSIISTELSSSSVSSLSSALSAEEHLRIENDDFLSGQISANTEQIEEIKKSIYGVLNYTGNLSLDITVASQTISSLIYYNYLNKGEEISWSTVFRNGAFFITQSNDKSKQYSFSGVMLGHGDWLIFNKDTILSDATSSDVEVLDAEDYDNFKLSANNIIVGDNTFTGKTQFLNDATFSSDVLVANPDTLVSIVGHLSTQNTAYLNDALFKNGLSVQSNAHVNGNLDVVDNVYLSSNIFAKQNMFLCGDVAVAGNAVFNELSIDLNSTKYTVDDGTICSIANLSNVIAVEMQQHDTSIMQLSSQLSNAVRYFGEFGDGYGISPNYLTSFLDKNIYDHNFQFQQGYEYRISNGLSVSLQDSNGIEKQVFGNDFLLFNKAVVLSDVTWNDIDIIYDAQAEILALSINLSNTVLSIYNELSTLSNDVEVLSNDQSTISNNVEVLNNDLSIISSDYVSKSTKNIISANNTFKQTQTFEQGILAKQVYTQNLSAQKAIFDAISIKDANKSYSFDGSNGLSALTSFQYLNGKIDIATKQLISSDVKMLPEFVSNSIEDAKSYVYSKYLPLSGGVLTGDLSIGNYAQLCIHDSGSLAIGNQSLCTILSNEITLSTQNAVNNLSTDLHDDFEFGYNITSNMISATVAGKTLMFSADRFTEARMLQSVYVGYPFGPSGNPVLYLVFKTEDPTVTTQVSVDLMTIMPLYDGKDGIDVNFEGGKFYISADETICRRSDISSIDIANSIVSGKILSSLQQENGVISYGVAPILSNYVEGLSNYVENALSTYNMPLSTIYGEWHIYPPTDKSGRTLSVKETVDISGGIWYTLVANGIDVSGPRKSYDPCYIEWSAADIYDTVTMRKADHYILGANIDKPIQPKLNFNSLSALDNGVLKTLSSESNMTYVIDAVVELRDMLQQLRTDIEHLSSTL